ncbi:MAG TPA: cell division ATP-binding protein FtsE [Armatimonadota bacterium]|jgi:cell division transport system ATP-binding protein|nr:cell division ATP-binding protein FtsE [Armatimonadota bacterium]HOM71063.1 cell division ATP-binding protein FtsE [Armatimonadota bacterium]HOP80086.1 cell division ATP-binding protein FtsE [Armatimonadota bacterium]HPP74969.1 cell division ATP-binding protein FtsE [Armatimonadota bacterium]
MIELCDVSLVYPNGVQALSHVDLRVGRGDFAFLVGTSGSGKSTLLKLLYRELSPTEGKVFIAGQDITTLPQNAVPFLRRRLGVVFQDFKLLPQKTVWENLAFVLRVTSVPRREMRKRISEALDLVGLMHRCDSFPAELSGGEQQRAAIARALVNNPPILVADEPTGNLDPDTSWGIMQILTRINARGTTILVATHDNQVVDRLMRRVIALDCGKIVRDENRGTYSSTPESESMCKSEITES